MKLWIMSTLLGILCIPAQAIVILSGGHGIAPIGILFVATTRESEINGLLVTEIVGIASIGLANGLRLVQRKTNVELLDWFGVLCLVWPWGTLVLSSSNRPLSLVSSIPFCVLVIVKGISFFLMSIDARFVEKRAQTTPRAAVLALAASILLALLCVNS
jgi:hypothetical protein